MNARKRGDTCPTWTPFTPREIERHVALHFFQGLNPSPQINMKFLPQRQDPLQGNDLVHRVECCDTNNSNVSLQPRIQPNLFHLEKPVQTSKWMPSFTIHNRRRCQHGNLVVTHQATSKRLGSKVSHTNIILHAVHIS